MGVGETKAMTGITGRRRRKRMCGWGELGELGDVDALRETGGGTGRGRVYMRGVDCTRERRGQWRRKW